MFKMSQTFFQEVLSINSEFFKNLLILFSVVNIIDIAKNQE